MEIAERPWRLTPGEPRWPVEFDQIDEPPACVWLRGRVDLLSARPRIALVGTRAPTPYGLAQARRFAVELAAAGVTIVSGLARGIDAAAHEGALEAGGATLAVLGSGVDRPWPAGELSNRLARDGLMLSELEPGTPPRRHHFPLRNRLISALSLGVLVVEAAHASGSLITARWAADQGREVWAIPGRVDHPMSAGAHRLIREGAMLVESPRQMLESLGLLAPRTQAGGSQAAEFFSGAELELWQRLEGETLTADELVERTGLELGLALTTLVELELRGHVARGPGGLWRRCR